MSFLFLVEEKGVGFTFWTLFNGNQPQLGFPNMLPPVLFCKDIELEHHVILPFQQEYFFNIFLTTDLKYFELDQTVRKSLALAPLSTWF